MSGMGQSEGNNLKFKELSGEQGGKVAQNVAAGVVGLVIWPVWFGMDFKGAADKEVAALQARQQYLTTLATEAVRSPAGRAGPTASHPSAISLNRTTNSFVAMPAGVVEYQTV